MLFHAIFSALVQAALGLIMGFVAWALLFDEDHFLETTREDGSTGEEPRK